jgi:hypothetical protein
MNRTTTIKRFTDWKANWSDPEPMDELEYLNFNIHPEDILMTGFLFFPELVEHKGGIFLQRNFNNDPEKLPSFDTVSKLEYEINKVWLFDLFGHAEPGENDEKTFLSLGQLLKHAWTSHLLVTYPEKSFDVELIVDEKNYGPILTFCQC